MRKITVKRCSVRNCPKRHYGKGFCKRHYTQLQRHGRLTPDLERSCEHACNASGCTRKDAGHRVGTKRFCKKHARQVRTHGKLTPEAEHAYRAHTKCSVRGCDEPHRAKGLCTKHYNAARWKKIKAAVDAATPVEVGATVEANPPQAPVEPQPATEATKEDSTCTA